MKVYVMLTIYYIEIVFCRVYESIRLYQEVHNFFPYQTMEFFFVFAFPCAMFIQA